MSIYVLLLLGDIHNWFKKIVLKLYWDDKLFFGLGFCFFF